MALLCIHVCLLAVVAARAEETSDIAVDLQKYEHNLTALNTIFAPQWVSNQ